MTLSKKYSTLIIASLIVSVLALGISYQDSTAETLEFDPTKGAINDLQIQTVFHFTGFGNLSLETFSVYEQVSGYKKDEGVSFRLFGMAGLDKIGLYKLSDKTSQGRIGSVNDPLNNFDIDVRILQNEQVLHEFNYKGCKIADYKVTTLFDADETFSGKTKFAIVDVFEFTCRGYIPATPLFDEIVLKIKKAHTTSTTELSPGVTWESYESFKSKGFEP